MKAFSQTLSFCFWFLLCPGPTWEGTGSRAQLEGWEGMLAHSRDSVLGGLPPAVLAPGKAQKGQSLGGALGCSA